MKKRVDLAVKYYESGYNCAQSVVLAYCDLFEMNKETAASFSSGLGGGVGKLNDICGTVSAMALLAGLKFKANKPGDDATKNRNYETIQQMAKAFRDKTGSHVCRELLGKADPVTPHINDAGEEVPVKEQPCVHYVRIAAEIVEEHLLNN
jgi:C_GCAxxG_C_C family probable redox protein